MFTAKETTRGTPPTHSLPQNPTLCETPRELYPAYLLLAFHSESETS